MLMEIEQFAAVFELLTDFVFFYINKVVSFVCLKLIRREFTDFYESCAALQNSYANSFAP